MKFSFGQYKGREIKDIAKENPYYLEWCLEHCLRLNHEEYCEIHRYYSELDSCEIRWSLDDLFKSDIRDIKELYLGKYFRVNGKYIYIKRVSERDVFKNTFEALVDQKIWVFDVVDADKLGTSLPEELVTRHHIWAHELMDKDTYVVEVTKEEFIENLKSVTERIINKL